MVGSPVTETETPEAATVGSHAADPYTDREMPGAERAVSQFGTPSGRNVRIALLDPGCVVVDCVNWPPAEGEPDHAWRGAVFRIVE